MIREVVRLVLGGEIDGMLVEYVILLEDGVVNILFYLFDIEVVILFCAVVIVWYVLIEVGLKLGEIVLVMGIGGVFLFVL